MIFRRRRMARGDEDIAEFMNGFFADLTSAQREKPEEVARAYARHVWARTQDSYGLLYYDGDALVDQSDYDDSEIIAEYRPPALDLPDRHRHHVALSVQSDGLMDLTKRAVLIADTLVISHQATDPYYSLVGGRLLDPGRTNERRPARAEYEVWASRPMDPPTSRRAERKIPENQRYWQYPNDLGMHCPDMGEVGRWLLGFEPLISTGLAWYVPQYVRPSNLEKGPPSALDALLNQPIFVPRGQEHLRHREELANKAINGRLVDYLVKDGRVVETLGADPVTNKYVRLILKIKLPFIAGVDSGDFSRITMDEFDNYERFKTFLRGRLLEVDDALNAVQSQLALERIGLEIKREVAKVTDEMERIRRKQGVAVAQAVVGGTGATLVAVYGPVFQQAIAAIGASSGLWMAIKTLAENSTRELRHNDWYYVWVLEEQRRRSGRPGAQ